MYLYVFDVHMYILRLWITVHFTKVYIDVPVSIGAVGCQTHINHTNLQANTVQVIDALEIDVWCEETELNQFYEAAFQCTITY